MVATAVGIVEATATAVTVGAVTETEEAAASLEVTAAGMEAGTARVATIETGEIEMVDLGKFHLLFLYILLK